jgi:hypothetical protein
MKIEEPRQWKEKIETSKDKNQEIEQVLRKLVELLKAKKDEAPSSSKKIVIHT